MDFIRERTPVRFAWVPRVRRLPPRGARRPAPPAAASSRCRWTRASSATSWQRLHPQYTKAPANLIVTQADFRKISLGLRTVRGPVTMAKVLVRRMVSLLRGRKMYAMGNALAIGLRQGLDDAGVPVHYETELTDLVHRGRPGGRRPRACSDGVEHVGPCPAWRDPRQRRLREEPRDAREVPALPHHRRLDDRVAVQHRRRRSWPASPPAPTTDLLDDAWWGPTIPLPRGPWFCLAERNLPGSIIVNSARASGT